jgi:hypothetical protein
LAIAAKNAAAELRLGAANSPAAKTAAAKLGRGGSGPVYAAASRP